MDNQNQQIEIGGTSLIDGYKVPNNFIFNVLLKEQAMEMKINALHQKEIDADKRHADRKEEFQEYASFILPLVEGFLGGKSKPCNCHEHNTVEIDPQSV